MNDGGSTLGGNQTGSGGTDALNSADLKISHDTVPTAPITTNTPATSPDPTTATPTATDTLSISHDDSSNNSSNATVSNPGNPDDEHVPILPPSSGPARLFGQDISGITDEDLSSSATAQPIPTTIFPNGMSSPEPAPNPDTADQPQDSTFNGVPTATPKSANQVQPEPTPAQSEASIVSTPTAPSTPPTPTTPEVPYEQQFLESLHPEANPKTKDNGDIILDPEASKRKTRRGLIIAIVLAALVIVVLCVVAASSFTNNKPVSNIVNSPTTAFNSYANTILYNTDSTAVPTEERDNENYYYHQEIYNNEYSNQEYLNQISQKYNDFYSRLTGNEPYYDDATAYKQLLDFMTINPSSSDFDSHTIINKYLGSGRRAAANLVSTTLSKIPTDNQYAEEFRNLKQTEFDSALQYYEDIDAAGCVTDEGIDYVCVGELYYNASDPENSAQTIMIESRAEASDLIDQYIEYIGRDCLQIKEKM